LLSWLKIEEITISDTSKPLNAYNYKSPRSIPNQTPDPIKSTNPITSVSYVNLNNQINASIRKSSSEITNTRLILEPDLTNKIEKGEAIELSISNIIASSFPFEKELKTKEILESKELFFVRNYIIRTKLMSEISSKDLKMLKKQFNKSHCAFDTSTIIDEYVFNSNKNLFCLFCKKSFSSPFDVVQNLECKGEYFHPRFILNAKNEKFVCSHEGCKKRVVKGEFPCCHKNAPSSGCLLGDGKHHLVLIDNYSGSTNNSF